MKATFIALTFTLISSVVFSQSNFYKIGIGGGAGITQSFTDVEKHGLGFAGYGAADFFFTPFISLGIEGQMGQVNGGDELDPHERQFINSYKAISVNGKLFLGNLINYEYGQVKNLLKGLYIGSGLGIIQNKMDTIVRKQQETEYEFVGYNSSKDILVPINLGLNLYFPDHSGNYRYVLNVNFQSNITFGEGLDGYDDSTLKFENVSPDIYNYISLGLKYQIGPIGLSKKTFRKP